MSITNPNPGKLKKSVLVKVRTQEQAYRVLLSVPDLTVQMQEELISTLVQGKEDSWVHLAMQKRLYKGGKKTAKLCTVLAKKLLPSNRFGYLMTILDHPASKSVRVQAMEKLLGSARYAGMLIKSDRRLQPAEMDLVVDMYLPKLTCKTADPILNRIRRNEVSQLQRARVINTLRKGDFFLVFWDVLWILRENAKGEILPPLSDEEKGIIIDLVSKDGAYSTDVMLPRWPEDDCKLSESNLRLLAPQAMAFLCDRKSSMSTNLRKGKIEDLLLHRSILTSEQIESLEKVLEELKLKVA